MGRPPLMDFARRGPVVHGSRKVGSGTTPSWMQHPVARNSSVSPVRERGGPVPPGRAPRVHVAHARPPFTKFARRGPVVHGSCKVASGTTPSWMRHPVTRSSSVNPVRENGGAVPAGRAPRVHVVHVPAAVQGLRPEGEKCLADKSCMGLHGLARREIESRSRVEAIAAPDVASEKAVGRRNPRACGRAVGGPRAAF